MQKRFPSSNYLLVVYFLPVCSFLLIILSCTYLPVQFYLPDSFDLDLFLSGWFGHRDEIVTPDQREIMDLDLNCSPPSPEPAAQDDIKRTMPRQHHAFRVKDLNRPYRAHQNLTDAPPSWKQSDGVLRTHPPHPSHMVNSDDTGVFSHCYGQVRPCIQRDHDEVAGDNLDVKGPVVRQPDPCIAQGMRSGYRCVIDLEKPATLDDDVEILSSQRFINYDTRNSVFLDNSQCVPPESSLVMGDLRRDHNTPYASYGPSGSSDTQDSHSHVRTKTSVSGCMLFDLNVAQEDDYTICPDSSKVPCSLLASSATRNSGGCCSNSSKTFHKGSESSIGSSKGSSVTVATVISAPDGVRKAMAAGLICDSQSSMPLSVETLEYNAFLRGNLHEQTLDKNSGLDIQGCMEIPWVSSVSSDLGNNSSSDISNLGDSQAANLTGQLPVSVHREPQEDAITVVSDSEMEIFDLNVPVEGIELAAKVASNYGGKPVNSYGSEENSCIHHFTQNEGRQSISLVECLTCRNHHMAENKADEDVQSPDPGIAINRSVLIPETLQGHDCAYPRPRSSNGVSIQLETVSVHQAKEPGEDDEISVATAAETLVSLNSAWMTDNHEGNSQADPSGTKHQPLLSLDSFEESVLNNLEEMKDDGESLPMRPHDKDAQSCGIKLKRGRGLRDFQREILPGLVSLARHEICDDLHAIGQEIRKTRSRRNRDDQGTPPTRTRLPRRCSTAWNR